jgi:wobble nucleotide-excising tRNase
MSGETVHDRKMADIQQRIDKAHQELRKRADDTLKNISDNYQTALLAKIGEELKLARQAIDDGDSRKAEMHRVRADVYKSALDALKTG